ncbi:MAG: cupin domain-containing protein [Alphaproteobacteria bacterium]|nr:cupin domain-containing protein [Alphaproteobacteria bacterium]
MLFRRIVTGHDLAGKSIVRSDEEVPATTLIQAPGFAAYELWSEKGERRVQHASGTPGAPRFFPEEDEVIARFCVFPPEAAGAPDIDIAAAAADTERRYPGMLSHFDPEAPGMHATDSVDFGFVIEGELDLELDSGDTVHLTRGCCVVQTGTWHAWRNRSGKPAVMAFILLGAKRRAAG